MKNIRSASVEAYKNVIESGFLSSQLIKAFSIVFRYGPLTSRQANTYFLLAYGGEDNLNQFRALLTHLQDMEVIATGDKIKCLDTHKTVYQFDVTGRMPTKAKKLSMADRKRDMLATVARMQPWLSDFANDEAELLKSQINNL